MSSLESGTGKGSDVEQHSKATYKAVETSPGEWKMGAMPVETSCKGLITVMDELTIETTGKFMSVNKKDPSQPKEFPW